MLTMFSRIALGKQDAAGVTNLTLFEWRWHHLYCYVWAVINLCKHCGFHETGWNDKHKKLKAEEMLYKKVDKLNDYSGGYNFHFI